MVGALEAHQALTKPRLAFSDIMKSPTRPVLIDGMGADLIDGTLGANGDGTGVKRTRREGDA
jgi:hypothetical protein